MQYDAIAPKTRFSERQYSNRNEITRENMMYGQQKKESDFSVKNLLSLKSFFGLVPYVQKVVLMLYLRFGKVCKYTENQCTIIRLLLIPY